MSKKKRNKKHSVGVKKRALEKNANRPCMADVYSTETDILQVLSGSTPLLHEQAHVLFERGAAAHRQGEVISAIDYYNKALAHWPALMPALNNLAVALSDRDQLDTAIALYHRAVMLSPKDHSAWSNLGNALRKLGRFDEAVLCHKRSLHLNDKDASRLFNAGLVYRDLNRPKEALVYFNKAIALKKDYTAAYWDRALALLQMGDFEQGFKEYEWRWRLDHHRPRQFDKPIWDGSDLSGKRLLISSEQGFGDMIQFVRYMPLLANLGAQVIVECPAELMRLFATVDGVTAVIEKNTRPPAFDCHCPIMSIPAVLGTTEHTIPTQMPYFSPPMDAAQAIIQDTAVLKVGVIWAGKPKPKERTRPALPTPVDGLRRMIRLMGYPGVKFYSLQKGASSTEISGLGCQTLLHNVDHLITDFADTAAIMSQLDLIISIDSSPAHLAGAMGRPVWVILPYTTDWRWQAERGDSPWYPSMRLFRCQLPCDWDSAFASLYQAFHRFVTDFYHKMA